MIGKEKRVFVDCFLNKSVCHVSTRCIESNKYFYSLLSLKIFHHLLKYLEKTPPKKHKLDLKAIKMLFFCVAFGCFGVKNVSSGTAFISLTETQLLA